MHIKVAIRASSSSSLWRTVPRAKNYILCNHFARDIEAFMQKPLFYLHSNFPHIYTHIGILLVTCIDDCYSASYQYMDSYVYSYLSYECNAVSQHHMKMGALCTLFSTLLVISACISSFF